MLLEPEFLHKNIIIMHICFKKQVDKAYINNEFEVRKKEKNRIFEIKFHHMQKW